MRDAPQVSEIPEIAEIDELQTFVGKKNKLWIWTAVNHWKPGILAWVIGDRSSETFFPLWKILRGWQCFLYVTDGYVVYPCFINDLEHLIKKTYMTRVEGENTRLRHYLARLKRKTLCYSKKRGNAETINKIATALSVRSHYTYSSINHPAGMQRQNWYYPTVSRSDSRLDP